MEKKPAPGKEVVEETADERASHGQHGVLKRICASNRVQPASPRDVAVGLTLSLYLSQDSLSLAVAAA